MAADTVSTPDQDERLQEEVEEKIEKPEEGRQLFGTFGGVFTPTLLTILGVIMYLREGWVVGNAGLLGAWAVILLSFGITGFTGLSLASITTNIRIGAGGAFNIISQSLGLEVGGSIGVPLYVSQALAVAMYIFGFRAGWLWVFPDHSPLVVDLAVFAVLFGIAFVSAGLAFRIQYLILAVIIASLASVGWSAAAGSMQHPVQWWGEFPGSPETAFQGVGFWAVFAVFFPASTGIMAGANMSGDLRNPRKAIPVGTLSAIAISLVVYMALAWWLARSAEPGELVSNYTVMIDKSAWAPVVLAGLLGATFSSALSSLVGAPRIMQALADHRILPGSKVFARRTAKGEPRNALFFTGLLVFAALMLRDLNAIAPLITMFFLITYAMINVVVLMEQNLKLVSFRPLLRIPRFVPLLGGAGCLLAMFVVNFTFGVVAVVVVLALHAWLIRKHLRAPFGDVRSGLFVAVAEWAAKKVEELAGPKERTWKANVLIPVESSEKVRRFFPLLRDIAYPKGFVRLLGLTGTHEREDLEESLPSLAREFREESIFSAWSVVDAAQFGKNLAAGMEALGGAFFTSNMLFLTLPRKEERADEVENIIRHASLQNIGIMLHSGEPEPEAGDRGEQPALAVWLPKPEKGWDASMELGNMDLELLLAYKLKRNWKGRLHLAAEVHSPSEEKQAREFLEAVAELARFPNVERHVYGTGEQSRADREIRPVLWFFPFGTDDDLERLRELSDSLDAPCVFTMDSGLENVLV